MNPFAWFAIILTVGYIIYYTVMIMNDLYGKKPEEQNNSEEIDVPAQDGDAITDEAPVTVTESDEGFSVGEEEYEANLIPDEQPVEEESVSTNETEEAAKTTTAENIRNNTDAFSEEIQSQFSDEYGAEDLKEAMLNEGHGRVGRPSVKVIAMHDEI